MSVSQVLGPTRRAELAQGPVSFREIGEGPPLVFVHGVFVNGDLWHKLVPTLAGRYRCVIPDWPLGSHREPMHEDADLTTPGLAKPRTFVSEDQPERLAPLIDDFVQRSSPSG